MVNHNPILVIGVDSDDFEMLDQVCSNINIPNKLIRLADGASGLAYLQSHEEKPFIILTDVYIHGMSGLDFRGKIETDPELRSKSVPFIFLSESLQPKKVTEVYSMSVQGLFDKPHTMAALEKMMRVIYDYWQLCRHPDQTKESQQQDA
jgi:CheY-like chemotaxis protein